MAILISNRGTAQRGRASSRRTTGVVVVGVLAMLALIDGPTHRSLSVDMSGVARKLCYTMFGYDNWGRYWESIFYKEIDYSVLGPRSSYVNDPSAVGYFLTLSHCPGDPRYAIGVDMHDPGHAFYDAAALLKHSITSNAYPKGSKYNATMYAIVHPEAVRCTDPKGKTYDRVAVLMELGYHVQIWGNPLIPRDLDDSVKEGIDTDAGNRNMMPLQLMDFSGHPIVVSVDFTTLVLQPLDGIFDHFIASGHKIAYSMDYPDNLPATGGNAGINTHFVMFKPTATTKDTLLQTYLATPFTEKWGWSNRGVKDFAGVYGMKGFLHHYFSRIDETGLGVLQRCKYGNEVHAPTGLDANGEQQCFDNLDCEDCRDYDMKDIKVLKMVETCGAPWDCAFSNKWDDKTKSMCENFHREWFERRIAFEKDCWQDTPPVKRIGDFKPDTFLGYCECAGPDCYELMIHDNPETRASPPTYHEGVDPPRVLQECKGHTASWWGDPHFTTFDGLKFDCRGSGEFNIATNVANDFLIQGRFQKYPSGKPSTTNTAIAIRDTAGGANSVVQIAITENPSATTRDVSGCTVDLYVDGVKKDLFGGSYSSEVFVKMANDIATVEYLRSGLTVDVKILQHTHGCELAAFVCIPQAKKDYQTDVVGLLGNIDDDKRSDWMGADNSAVRVPRVPRRLLHQRSHDYCVKNWCVRDEKESLFTYEAGLSHATYFQCDAAYEGNVNIGKNVPQVIHDICGDDRTCLLEGVSAGKDMAQLHVQNLKQLAGARANSVCKSADECDANQSCINGNCACNASFSDCDGNMANGCEAPTQDDAFSCATEKKCNYFNDFEKHLNMGEWKNFDDLDRIRSGKGYDTTFLGGLGRNIEAPTLKVKLGKDIDNVYVQFDFLELDSWDGSQATWGGDYLEIFLTGDAGTKSFKLTFSKDVDEGHQKGNADGLEYAMVSKVAPMDFYGDAWRDQIHTISLTFPGSFLGDGYLALTFNVVTSEGVQGGLDNISVSSCSSQ